MGLLSPNRKLLILNDLRGGPRKWLIVNDLRKPPTLLLKPIYLGAIWLFGTI